ncbi:MAG TPA: DNA translocase FtsK 4TM domain-containing protein, partial [Rudaea sp.]|nr:DNA translocase FtsK 4TM domain-containing protein [Rudaea sp.]
MARDSRNKSGGDPSEAMQRRLREAAFLLLAPVAVYLFLCLITYSTDDPGWNHAAAHAQQVQNLGGA